MSYDTERVKAGREPAYMVDLLLDYCDLTYGTAPCAAVLGVTGAVKCFNTRSTCQDPANYTPSPKTYRFVQPMPGFPAGFERISSSLRTVKFSPTSLDESGGLGQRAMVTLEFQDHPHHDRGIDKYVGDRSYDPQEQGTFWGRLRARNPYYKGRILRLWEGFLTEPFDIGNFRQRDFVIESISPPDSSGRVRVVAKDILKLADGDKAVFPPPTSGTLAETISSTAKTIKLATGTGAQYGTSGEVAIEKEIISFSGRTGDTLTGCIRGIDNTEKSEHSADEQVQLIDGWDQENAADIIRDLLTTAANVPASYIDDGVWDTERDTHLSTFLLTRKVVKPTPVRKLLQEIMKQCLIAVWVDDLTSKVQIKSLTPWADSEGTITDTAVIGSDKDPVVEGSLNVSDQPDKRVSRVRVYHGIRNWFEDDDEENFKRWYFDIDGSLEADDKFGEVAERVFHSRWFTVDDVARPALLASRLISRYGEIPQAVEFTLDARHAKYKHGAVIDLESRMAQSADGSNGSARILILQVTPDGKGHHYHYRGVTFSPQPDPVLTISKDTRQLNVFTLLSAPGNAVSVTVNIIGGVNIYSDDPTIAAFDSGPMPAGSDITLVPKGSTHIYGCGGAGGKGGYAEAFEDPYSVPQKWDTQETPGTPGEDAGPAVESSVDISIDNSDGYIFGGGGGGAGGQGFTAVAKALSGGGGGGGQSYHPTQGGLPGDAVLAGQPATLYEDPAGSTIKASTFESSTNGEYDFYAEADDYVIIEERPDNLTVKPRVSLATVGADWDTTVAGRPAELTDGRVAAGLAATGDVARNVPDNKVPQTAVHQYIGGYGVNICHPRYSTFEEIDLPPLEPGTALVAHGTGALAKRGDKALKITTTDTSASGTVYLAESATDYNFPIEPGKTYILSFDARLTGTSSHDIIARLRTNNASDTFWGPTTPITIDASYQRYSVEIDIPSSSTISAALVAFGVNRSAVSGVVMAIDGVKVEEKYGNSGITPVFSYPGVSAGNTGAAVKDGILASLRSVPSAGVLSYGSVQSAVATLFNSDGTIDVVAHSASLGDKVINYSAVNPAVSGLSVTDSGWVACRDPSYSGGVQSWALYGNAYDAHNAAGAYIAGQGTIPSSGSSGGGGGSSCVAVGDWLHPWLRAEDVRAGDVLDGAPAPRYRVLKAPRLSKQPCVELITESGLRARLSCSTSIDLPNGGSRNVMGMYGEYVTTRRYKLPGWLLRRDKLASNLLRALHALRVPVSWYQDRRIERVVNIIAIGKQDVMAVNVGGKSLVSGVERFAGIVSHNQAKPL